VPGVKFLAPYDLGPGVPGVTCTLMDPSGVDLRVGEIGKALLDTLEFLSKL
jgi:hypothetical protein